MGLDKYTLQKVTFQVKYNRLQVNAFLTMIESRVHSKVRNVIFSIFSSFVKILF